MSTTLHVSSKFAQTFIHMHKQDICFWDFSKKRPSRWLVCKYGRYWCNVNEMFAYDMEAAGMGSHCTESWQNWNNRQGWFPMLSLSQSLILTKIPLTGQSLITVRYILTYRIHACCLQWNAFGSKLVCLRFSWPLETGQDQISRQTSGAIAATQLQLSEAHKTAFYQLFFAISANWTCKVVCTCHSKPLAPSYCLH